MPEGLFTADRKVSRRFDDPSGHMLRVESSLHAEHAAFISASEGYHHHMAREEVLELRDALTAILEDRCYDEVAGVIPPPEQPQEYTVTVPITITVKAGS